MAVTLVEIKKLREKTGAGITACKKALEYSKGDFEKAVEYLREQGIAKSQKRAGKSAREGVIGVYLHSNKKVAAMIELNCETDFAARSEDFIKVAHDFAMQVAAMAPEYKDRESISDEVLEKERKIYSEELRNEGKPDNLIEKIVEGKLEKFYEQSCLMDQKFIKDDSKSMADYLNEAVVKIGERLEVGEFARLSIN